MTTATTFEPGVGERVECLDWPAIASGLDDVGCALTDPVLSPTERALVSDLYDELVFP